MDIASISCLQAVAVWAALFLAACTPVSRVEGYTLTPQIALSAAPLQSIEPTSVDEISDLRNGMVENLVTAGYLHDPRVVEAMQRVPRHAFIPQDLDEFAYNDTPLPIGYGQTISAPSIVALMTELLELKKGDKVLEIGTGSGYQAAVLAEAEDVEVYTIEIIPELAERARENLAAKGYEEVFLQQGDGYYGWPENAPYDAIIVTAAPDHLPEPLVQQLKEGGRLVIPIGPPGSYQTLWKFVKQEGNLKAYNITGVVFVPFTGAGIQQKEVVQTQVP